MSNAKHIISEKVAEAVDAAIAEALGDAYDCTRVWSAWGVGTMGPDDFYSVADDGDRVAEIRDAAIAALQPEFEAIKRQRDQLLSALKQVQVDVKNGNCVMADTAVFVDSAIAAVEQPEEGGAACATCAGRGVVGRFVNAQSGYEDAPCPDCATADEKGGAA